jgi:hypothetical protein
MKGIAVRRTLQNIFPDYQLNCQFITFNPMPHWKFIIRFLIGNFDSIEVAKQYSTFLNADWMIQHTGLEVLNTYFAIVKTDNMPSIYVEPVKPTVYFDVVLNNDDLIPIRDQFQALLNVGSITFRYFQNLTKSFIKYNLEIEDEHTLHLYYDIGPLASIDEANNLMDKVTPDDLQNYQYYIVGFPSDQYNVTDIQSYMF